MIVTKVSSSFNAAILSASGQNCGEMVRSQTAS